MFRRLAPALGLFVLSFAIAACTFSLAQPVRPPPASQAIASAAPSPDSTVPASQPGVLASPAVTTTATIPPGEQTGSTPFCTDPQPVELITKFKTAILDADGDGLASLVSPTHGMEVRLFRNGRIVTYDRVHAAALFDSSFSVNWGLAPGSGLATVGSFQDLVVPDLLDVLTRDFQLSCNQVEVGGATYTASWPYDDLNFYSVYFPGSNSLDEMDWHTWLVGFHYVDQKPYLFAIMQLFWEP